MAKVVPFDSCQIDTCTIPMDQAQMGKEDEGYTELMIRVEKKMMEWASKRKLVIPANVRSFPDIHANEHLIPHKVRSWSALPTHA